MTVDIRAVVTCSLGPLISASLNDDYIQETGLIKTRGSCEIKGLITPDVGSTVTFQYTKSGITRRIPKTLRVLSSFADPFRRITTVELGCKLTYLEDLAAPIKWDQFDDPVNAAVPEEERIVTLPIRASSIMDECLSALGITAALNPLTNQFSIAEFDFGPGYVNVLSDLLVSESFCGYLDESERLQIIDLDQSGGSGPVLAQSKIIDVGPIGVGQLPADTVVVRYNTLKLRNRPFTFYIGFGSPGPGDDPEPPGFNEPPPPESAWGNDEAETSTTNTVAIAYTDPETGDPKIKEYTTLESSSEISTYFQIETRSPDLFRVVERRNLLASRTITEKKSAALVLGGYLQAVLEQGGDAGDFEVESETLEVPIYDEQDRVIVNDVIKTGDAVQLLGALGIDFVVNDELLPLPEGKVLLERTHTEYFYAGDVVKTITTTFGPWVKTVTGQQAIAASADALFDLEDVQEFISTNLFKAGEYLLSTRVDTRRTGFRGEEAPSFEEIDLARAVDPPEQPADRPSSSGALNGPFRTEDSASIELVTGARDALRRIEFTMPYAPDDRFSNQVPVFGIFTPVWYYVSFPSDAPAKAMRYGRTQNRILLGNRSGMNIQAAPEDIPTKPFAPFFIQAAGVTGLYRTNGTAWTISSDGIVVATDALAWGVAGKNT